MSANSSREIPSGFGALRDLFTPTGKGVDVDAGVCEPDGPGRERMLLTSAAEAPPDIFILDGELRRKKGVELEGGALVDAMIDALPFFDTPRILQLIHSCSRPTITAGTLSRIKTLLQLIVLLGENGSFLNLLDFPQPDETPGLCESLSPSNRANSSRFN